VTWNSMVVFGEKNIQMRSNQKFWSSSEECVMWNKSFIEVWIIKNLFNIKKKLTLQQTTFVTTKEITSKFESIKNLLKLKKKNWLYNKLHLLLQNII